MNRKMLEKMTKKELIELVERQSRAIDSLDLQRYDATSIIKYLVTAVETMEDLRNHELERSNDQDYLNDYVYQMCMKYPAYIVSVKKEGEESTPQDEQPS